MSTTVQTTCPYCGVGCGVDVQTDSEAAITIKGSRQHPANYGRLCSKGSALAETVSHDDRLTTPLIHGEPTAWPAALETIAHRFQTIIDEHGPDAVAFYVSGQLLTEDYYVANKLIKGFIGTANIDTNSRLCMSSSVAGHKRAFGCDTVPGNYEDLELADLIILTGSNTAWCHPVLFQRIARARKDRANTDNPLKVVVIDPRKTATCDIADLHIPLRSGTDSVLFNGLLTWLHDQGFSNQKYINDYTDGFEEALRTARWYAPSAESVAEHCDVDAELVKTFYRWFSHHHKTVTVYSQGINQSSSGTDKVNAIINCHLLTGRIGLPGMGPFSVTGQPNAMGGREVGALSNQLAAHMDFDNSEHVKLVENFWNASRMASRPGLKAVDLFHAIENGEVKAVWIMATNPAVSLPDNNQVRRALEKCDFVVVSDCVHTDTTAFADALLPVQTWGEKNGTVTNSERRISRQRNFLAAPGEAKPDWWILSQFAQLMGFTGFNYQSPAQIFREYAQLSGHENHGERDFDISSLADMSDSEYDQLSPLQWPVTSEKISTERMFSQGRFFTANQRARFVAVTPRPPARLTTTSYPMILNTGRVRDQWHTMTRTGRSARLSGHVSEPYAEIHPDDAGQLSINDGELVQLNSQWGEVIVRARLSETQRINNVFVPFHWSDQFASAAGIDAVVNPELDPVSGQPEFKHTPIRTIPYRPQWHGFLLTRKPVEPRQATYWCKTRRYGMWHYELAGEEVADEWSTYARSLLCDDQSDTNWSELFDKATSVYRAARFVGKQLDAVLFIGPDYHLPERDWLTELFKKDELSSRERMRVLAGSPGAGQQDSGRIICSCFSVGKNALVKAIKEKQINTPEGLGEYLQAGTNCGSCVPELRALISETLAAQLSES